MKNSFFFGHSEDFLFPGLNLDSILALIVAAVVTGALTFAFEGFKILRAQVNRGILQLGCQCNPCLCKVVPAMYVLQRNNMSHKVCIVHDRVAPCELIALRQTSDGKETVMTQVAPDAAYGTLDHCPATLAKEQKRSLLSRICTMQHLGGSLMQMIQVFWAYMLMLVVMSYNGYIALAVLVGSTLGFFVFGLFLR